MRVVCLMLVFTAVFFITPLQAQYVIAFDDQEWSTDQSLDLSFAIDGFLFSSNKNIFTNYGYNFDVYNVSVYFVFQEPAEDRFTITGLNNELFNLYNLDVYQVSELSTDTLIIEGWDGSTKVYTNSFLNITTWQTLTLNYTNINKVVIKLGATGNENLTDFNFDNFSFNDAPLPVELVNFNASAVANHIKLTWQTATEINNYGFEIERQMANDLMTNDNNGHLSLVNGQWIKIGFVKGESNSNVTRSYSFADNSVVNGNKYKYRLKQIDNNGDYKYSQEIEAAADLAPLSYSLSQNYPNPFNPSTSIQYSVSSKQFVSLKVYDIIGNEVATLVDEYKEAGSYSANFHAENLSSGIYIYKLIADDPSTSSGLFVSTRKMILIK